MTYISATVTESFREGDGRLHFRVQYVGNAGEPPIVKSVYISENLTLAAMELRVRGQAMDEIERLNSGTTIFQTVQAALPYLLDTTTPLPTNTPTPTVIYMAASLPFTPGATPQDVFTLTGSNTRNVTDVLAFNFNGAILPAGMSVSAWFAWFEN